MRAWRRFLREPSAVVGLAVLIGIVLFAVIGPLLDPISPLQINDATLGRPQPPSAAHPLGTDIIGRDVLVRAMYGARVSLIVGTTAMIVTFAIGLIYGAVAGAAGGLVDSAMMRFVDAMLSFPTFFLLLIVAALTERFSLAMIVLIIGLTSWPGVARLVRAEVLSLRERDFVEAARSMGASAPRIIRQHLIPNALAPVFVAAAFAVGDYILAEASLSFFGLGVQPPQPSWGNMLQDALTPQAESAPWMVVTPGLLIVMTILALSLIADGLRVAFDTRIGQDAASPDDVFEAEPNTPYAPAPLAD